MLFCLDLMFNLLVLEIFSCFDTIPTSILNGILYPKKYINISTRAIEFKLGGFYREQRIEWDAINQISEGKNSISLHSGDRVIRINMLHFPLSDEKRIKSTINSIAEAKM